LTGWTDAIQMIPPDMKFDAQASPPQWTNNEDQVVEKGVNVRIRIRAVKVQIDKLTAIGTINEVSSFDRNHHHIDMLIKLT